MDQGSEKFFDFRLENNLGDLFTFSVQCMHWGYDDLEHT